MILRIALFVVLSLSVNAHAANHYIRAGAAGTASGNDWTNAYTTIPASPVRGDTYYVADGAYGSWLFNVGPQTGGSTITVKKATVADHGIATGWSDTYGDGQSTFDDWDFDTSNWVLDGVTRNESDWFDRSAYGFVVGTSGSQTTQINMLNCDAVFHNITIKYTAVRGYSDFASLPTGSDIGAYAIRMDQTPCTGSQYTGMVFHRMLVQGAVNQFFIRTSTGTIIEYTASEDAIGNSGNHGDTINAYYSVQNAVIRYNKFRHEYTTACGGCGSTGIVPYCCGSGGLEFYGNWVSDFRGGDGVIGYSTCTSQQCPNNSKVYNNTFDSCNSGTGGDGGIQLGNGTGNVAYNNIWTNCGGISFTGVTHDYNTFGDASTHSESNGTMNFSTSNFVNYANLDFRLTGATTAGTTISSPYNVDGLGTTRGADGTWDRGAFEYVSGGGGGGSVSGSHPSGSPRMAPMIQLRRGS